MGLIIGLMQKIHLFIFFHNPPAKEHSYHETPTSWNQMPSYDKNDSTTITILKPTTMKRRSTITKFSVDLTIFSQVLITMPHQKKRTNVRNYTQNFSHQSSTMVFSNAKNDYILQRQAVNGLVSMHPCGTARRRYHIY